MIHWSRQGIGKSIIFFLFYIYYFTFLVELFIYLSDVDSHIQNSSIYNNTRYVYKHVLCTYTEQ